MQITFDPHNPEDCATVARLLSSTAAVAETPAPTGTAETPAPTETPALLAYNQNDVAATLALYRGSATALQFCDEMLAEPDPETPDIHGMTWRDDIHSNPPSLNADGSWRAKRGKKDEYKAAIAAHKAAEQSDAPAPVEQPVEQPAVPEPTTPPAPIEYGMMATRFVKKLEEGSLPEQYETIYSALGVSYDDLQTNQTSIARLWHYMDALDNGDTHGGAVRHAMGQVQ